MSATKSGRVKFFNSQKGYGFIIPAEPIDGHAEVFVHHTVIHNRGGFKSLAEGESVEFEVVRGPKGLQATRVTGPDGSYVRGDPYSRFHSRMVFVPATTTELGSSPAAGPYYPFTPYSLPTSYSQAIPYGGQAPQPQYAAFGYSASPPPQSTASAAVATSNGDGGFAIPTNNQMRDLEAVVGSSPALPQRYYGIMMPVPHKQHNAAVLPNVYSAFVRQQQPQMYDYPTAFTHPVPVGGSHSVQYSAPTPSFSVSSRQNTGSSQISSSQYTKLSE
ncbi:hypothetical protein GGH96_005832 [Coemansia sp. RSA 1972]|nr:hypothetical protein GGH96_005832 [Coemansia sp. RSA 1972]